MAWGFVSAYTLSVAFAFWIAPWSSVIILPITAWCALCGVVGGALPDIDQLEFCGPLPLRKYFTHKKTLHYITGYLILTIILLGFAIVLRQYVTTLVLLASVAFGAWFHSMMDPFDGWRDDRMDQGIFEHVRRKWIASLHLVPFAKMWEWVIQAFAALCFIAISANLSQLIVPGWQLGTGVYFMIWLVSVLYDARYRAPKRQAKEAAQLQTMSSSSAQ